MPNHQTFNQLVNDQTGFVGRVAYTFYKDDKLAWIRGFHDKNGRDPSDSELDQYFHIGINQGKLDEYLHKAERVLNEFIDLTASEEIRSGIESYKQSDTVQRYEGISSKVEATHKKWLADSQKTTWQTVKESLYSSVLSSFIITGITVLVYLGGIVAIGGFRDLVHRVTAPDPIQSLSQPPKVHPTQHPTAAQR